MGSISDPVRLGAEASASDGGHRPKPPSGATGSLNDGRRVSEYPTLRCSARRSRGLERSRRSSPPCFPSCSRGSVMRMPGPTTAPLGFAAPPILLVRARAPASPSGRTPTKLIEFVLTPIVLPGIFVVNLIVLVYRLVAIVDAYRVTAFLNAVAMSGGGRLGRPRLVVQSPVGRRACSRRSSSCPPPMSSSPVRPPGVGVPRRPCVFLANDTSDSADLRRTHRAVAVRHAAGRATSRSTRPRPSPSEPPVQGSALPNASVPPWNGTERLNILLIGSDQRPGRRHVQHRHADRRLDRPGDEAGRDVQPAARLDGPAAAAGQPARVGLRRRSTRTRSTRSSPRSGNRADLVAGHQHGRAATTPSRPVLGNLYQLDIKYFVEVNFQGFKQVVDAVGGVTINVQVPVIDDSYPADSGRHARIYIPAGIQHMTGAAGARLRPIAPRLGRLRSGLPPAAGPDVAPRAGQRRQPDPADPGAARRRSRRRSGPTSRRPSSPSWPVSPAASTRRTSARTCSRTRATAARSSPRSTSTCPTWTRSGWRSPTRSRSIPTSSPRGRPSATRTARSGS